MEAEDTPDAPFLIVTAILSKDEKHAFAQALQSFDIQILGSRHLFDWPRLSNALHPPLTPAHSLRSRAYAKAWQARSPDAALWLLGGSKDFARLLEHKRALRGRFPSQEVQVELPEGAVQVRLHSFHAPDRGCIEAEWDLVKALGLRPPAVGKEL